MAEIEEIFQTLLERDYAEELFRDLGPSRDDTKNNRKASCPFCQGNDFSFSTAEAVYHCFNCGESGSWIHYLERARGMSTAEAISYLAEEAGLSSSVDTGAYQKKRKKQDLLEAALAYCREALFQEQGSRVLAYLEGRGYSPEEARGMGLGALGNYQDMTADLRRKGYTDQEIQGAGLHEDLHPLVMAWRDTAGRPTGIISRAIVETEPKYLYSRGLSKETPLGIHKARRSERAILVEGPLDQAYLEAQGLPAVALGQAGPSRDTIRALEKTSCREVLLALDNDEAGREGTRAALRSLRSSRLRAYVITLPEGYKDPDQLIREKGLEDFRTCLKRAKRGGVWYLEQLASQFNMLDIPEPREVDGFMEEALPALAVLEDPLGARDYRRTLQDLTGLSEQDLNTMLEKHRAELERERLHNRSRDLEKALGSGDLERSAQIAREIQAGASGSTARGLPVYTLDQLQEDLQSNRELGLQTGWRDLDRIARIQRGALTVVAGRTRHGKTAFMLNLLRQWLELYPDRSFIFATYEESPRPIFIKLLMSQAHEYPPGRGPQDSKFMAQAYREYLRQEPGQLKSTDQAIAYLKRAMEEGRLLIVPAHQHKAPELADNIRRLDLEYPLGGVFVDYLQIVPISGSSKEARYQELQRIARALVELGVSEDIPVVAGAQIRRPTGGSKLKAGAVTLESLRESGDIEQEANMVIGLFNEAVEEDQDTEDSLRSYETETDLAVKILKARDQGQGDCTLHYNMALCHISDQEA